MTMQKQIENLHNRLNRADECQHVVFLTSLGEPVAVPMVRLVGIYQCPELEDLASDILEAVKGG